MINLPDSTRVFKQMPTENFVKHLNDANRLKMKFMEEISSIVMINTLSPETMTISPGKIVTAIAVVEISLTRQGISQNLLEILDREINPATVLIIRYEDWGQIWCSSTVSDHDRSAEGTDKTYYQTNWLPYDELELKAAGVDLDQVYENFLLQITGTLIKVKNASPQKEPVIKTAKPAAIKEFDEVSELKAVIKKLETQIKHEKQFKRHLELMVDLTKAKEQLQKIKAPPLAQMKIVQTNQTSMLQNNIEMIKSYFPRVFVNMTAYDGNQFVDSSEDLKTMRMP